MSRELLGTSAFKRKPPFARVRAGDTIKADVRGRVFEATVREVREAARELVIDPPPNVGYYVIQWRQVTGWRSPQLVLGRSRSACDA